MIIISEQEEKQVFYLKIFNPNKLLPCKLFLSNKIPKCKIKPMNLKELQTCPISDPGVLADSLFRFLGGLGDMY
jgi:hypothetical protein